MNVCVPHELYRTPRLRQAAGTLCVSRESVVEKVFRTEKSVQYENEVRIDNRLESEVEKKLLRRESYTARKSIVKWVQPEK